MQDAKQSVSKFMADDHDRLDAILKEFLAVKGKDPARAKTLFSSFDRGLRRHIRWEEDILFPPFEERTGMRGTGPTAVMRQEHVLIQGCLKRIREKVASNDLAVDAVAREMVGVLGDHNLKEENVLYPWFDGNLGAQERSAIFSRMDAVPETAAA